MTQRTTSTSGAGSGRSQATPAELQKAALGFQQLSNACGGMLESTDLQSGGQYELEAIMPEDQKLGAEGALPVPKDFFTMAQQVTQGFLGALINARQQFADATVDLMQVAGDFKTADGTIPKGATRLTAPNADLPAGIPPGMLVYITKDDKLYVKDKDGTVVELPVDPGGFDSQASQVVNQKYVPPTESAK